MVIQKVLSNTNLSHIFECGQCFRWNSDADGSYIGVVENEVVRARIADNTFILDGTTNEAFWKNYFDLNADYTEIKNKLNKDKILKKCIEYGYGIRILKQEPFEAIISFIISANNNIPRIKKIIEALCRLYGQRLEFEGREYYTFPTAQTLAKLEISDLAPIRAGFRDKYIIDAARKISSSEVDLQKIHAMSTVQARNELMKIKGVGKKVADCVLLFGFSRLDVFPQDVWIKRILNDAYSVAPTNIDEFSRNKFGAYGGLAQQYLFYYHRDGQK